MGYQAEARIVCRIIATGPDVTIRGRKAPVGSHATFNAMTISQRLFNVPPAAVGEVPDSDKAVCFAKAAAFVKSELPDAYSLDPALATAIPGHAWQDGRWVPIDHAKVSYDFPLLRHNEPIEDECVCSDAAGNQQSLTMSWRVVVQPK